MSDEKSELGFDEKVILVLYQKFFGRKYDGSEEAKENVQNMCYLLSLKGFRVGDFGYTCK